MSISAIPSNMTVYQPVQEIAPAMRRAPSEEQQASSFGAEVEEAKNKPLPENKGEGKGQIVDILV